MIEWSDSASYNFDPPTTTCNDNGYFYDVDGLQYDCMWYESGSNCANYGGLYAHAGVTANDACCACGVGTVGGVPSKAPTPVPTDPTNAPTPPPTNKVRFWYYIHDVMTFKSKCFSLFAF